MRMSGVWLLMARQLSRSELRAQQRTMAAQIAECEASGSSLDERIERLNQAKRRVAPIDEGVASVRSQVVWNRDVDRWKGTGRNRYDDFASDVDDVLRKYASDASDVYGHICDQITALENQRNDNAGVLGWVKKQLNGVQNELEKMVN